MQYPTFSDALQGAFGMQLPRIGGALLILVIGWLIAVLVRALVRRGLQLIDLDTRISRTTTQPVAVSPVIVSGVFWLILLATLVAVLNALDLGTLSLPLAELMSGFLGYLPHLVAGGLLTIVAWIVAALVRTLSARALAATSLDDKLSAEAGMAPMSRSLSSVLFWIVLLLFLPAVLSAFELRGVLEPVQAMVAELLTHVPDVVGALVLAVVGWLVARVLRGLVTSVLAAAGLDRLNEKLGLDHSVQLSSLIGTIVFILVFVPALIAALDSAGLQTIALPASQMLSRFLEAVPQIIAAAIILLLTFYVGRLVADLLGKLLENAGFDSLPSRLGLGEVVVSDPLRPSVVARRLVLFFAMLFAIAEAADRLGFGEVRELVGTFIRFGGDILLGTVILLIGFWLANLLFKAFSQRNPGGGSNWAAQIGRAAIIGLVVAMGLRAMGVANEIVQLAFGLSLGAVAVAFALAFGLGGREPAARLLGHWVDKLLGRDR
ncbi:MAG: mechanosensitive ion channel [Burkholderiaceae bacterium]